MGIPDNQKYKTNIEKTRNSEIQQTSNLQALRQQYRHQRMKSKNEMLNQYKSLSIMNGDDMSQILNRSGKIALSIFREKEELQQDFDDISSIYTMANAHNDKLQSTLKRVKTRDYALSVMEENEELMELNN